MGVSRQQKATWPMRGKMRSPGRPPGWQREQVQRFWVEIAKGDGRTRSLGKESIEVKRGRGGIRRW